MNENNIADVLILARGGGSIEDLWPFNEEIVARAIYESKIPIISAVGHETDFTIADFVADLRAPTPSAAAELAQVDVGEIAQKLNTYENRLRQALRKKIEIMRLRYEKLMASRVFTDPFKNINEKYLYVDSKVKQLDNLIQKTCKDTRNNLTNQISKLDALSPLRTLVRGYSVIECTGKVVKTAKELNVEDIIKIKMQDGNVKAVVKEVNI